MKLMNIAIIGLCLFILFLSCSKKADTKKQLMEDIFVGKIKEQFVEEEITNSDLNITNTNISEKKKPELNEIQEIIHKNIYELLYSMFQDEEKYDYSYKWSEKKRKVKELFIDFLQTDIDWDEDITLKLPFFDSVCLSDDGLMKIYNKNFETRGTGDFYDHLLQYKTEKGIIILEPNFLSEVEYYRICILRDNLYLLEGIARAGGFVTANAFTTIQMQNHELITYPAFNGGHEFTFYFYTSPDGHRANIKESRLNIEEDIYIELVFHNGNTIKFVFNGNEFLGEYEEFYN